MKNYQPIDIKNIYYWSNYHSHCQFCDGHGSMEEFVASAIAKGVKKFGFSSHAPLSFNPSWTMKVDKFADYVIEFERLKLKYKDEIELFLGLEVDYIHDCSDVQNDFFKDKKFDYLIGSIHFVDRMSNGQYWGIDAEISAFDSGLKDLFDGDIKLAVERFFEISASMINKGGFDIVGHLDKIAINAGFYKEFSTKMNWYETLVAETLQLIKAKNLLLEINTRSLSKHGVSFPNQQFYSLINDLQIPVVVNSDCHELTNIKDGFEVTFEALKKAGFKTMHQLNNSEWQAVEFDEKGLRG